ncbi:MAG: PAS domain S-box protein [Tepidisphaeraceae bacterium]|jgi:two-component system CheB/CheR fusion protein
MSAELPTRQVWQRYAIAVLAVAAGAAARMTVLRSLGTQMPFVTFYPAVMIAALYAGFSGGLLATVLATIAALFWIQPVGDEPWVNAPAHWLGTALFVACCATLSWLCDAIRRAQVRTSQAEAQVRLACEREAAAEVLRQSEERLRFHVENTPLAVIEWGADFRLSRWSAEAERIFGWRAEEVLGKRLDEFRWVFEEDVQQVARVSAGLVDGTRRRSVSDNRNYRKDGSVVHCVWHNSSLVDASGKLVSILSLVLNVTEQKRAEETLAKSEATLRAILNATTESVWLFSPDGRVLLGNSTAVRRFGQPAGEIIGRHFAEIMPRELAKSRLERVRQTIDSHQPVEFEDERNGTRFHHSFYPVLDAQGCVSSIACFSSDITGRKQAEAMLRRYEVLAAQSRDIILFIGRDNGRVLEANAAAIKAYGRSREELLALTIHQVRAAETQKLTTAQLEEADMHGILFETVHQRRDGSTFPVEVSSRGATIDGSRILVSVVRDITERKRAEGALLDAKVSAEKASAAAEKASRAKDQFLAALSHELRTPLTPVVAAAGALLRDPRLLPEVREDLETIHRNVGLEVALINDLLDVTRIASGKLVLHKDHVDAIQVLREAARICSGDLDGKSQILTIDAGGEPCLVDADAARLHQVFWNLVKNAIKFTPPGGRITIACHRTGGPDACVAVSVSDTGIGIDPAVLARLFTPFEQGEEDTTHRFGGLGLGLAITKAIVELHGGRISAASEGKGKGATFIVELPLLSVLSNPSSVVASPDLRTTDYGPLTAAKPLRILLVEDHVDTARMMARLLTADGHSVVNAGSVKDALAMAAADTFDVLVSDLGLPDGDGHALLRQLRERGVSARAIALSGYGAASDVQKSREAGFSEHITKPVDLDALNQALMRVASAGRSESIAE